MVHFGPLLWPFLILVLRFLQKGIREFLCEKKISSGNFSSLPLFFILITRVIVGSLQMMACNQRGGRGVLRSLSLRGSPVSWHFKEAERAERKTGWLCQKGREIWRQKLFWGAPNLVARAIRNAIDSRESFAIEAPIFTACQAESHESLEFPIPGDSRESIRANHATKAPKFGPIPKHFTQMSRLLGPQNSMPVFQPFFLGFPSCSPWLVLPRTVPLLHG